MPDKYDEVALGFYAAAFDRGTYFPERAAAFLRSAFPPPAEDARQLAESICADTVEIEDAAIQIEYFVESRVEPWREATRNARNALSALAGVRRSLEVMLDYPCHSGITTPDKCGRCSRDMVAWDSIDALDALLSDSPAKEKA